MGQREVLTVDAFSVLSLYSVYTDSNNQGQSVINLNLSNWRQILNPRIKCSRLKEAVVFFSPRVLFSCS